MKTRFVLTALAILVLAAHAESKPEYKDNSMQKPIINNVTKEKRKMSRIVFPENWSVDVWYGYKRHHFTVEGCEAWIVEPEYPAQDGRWTWCAQWAEAFVPRVGTVAYLDHGFYHGHVDVHRFRGNPKGMEIMSKFQDIAVGLGLAQKTCLIGLSWGGFYSLRYAETYPDRVRSVYLDAPVCNAADPDISAASRVKQICEQWGMDVKQVKESPLNPLNNAKALADAKITVFAIVSGADNIVLPSLNFDLLEGQLKKQGAKIVALNDKNSVSELKNLQKGSIYVLRRRPWAHHPHGLDNVTPLMQFHWNVCNE